MTYYLFLFTIFFLLPFLFALFSYKEVFKTVGENRVLLSLPALNGGTELFSHLCL